MKNTMIAETSVRINGDKMEVWKTLTTPSLIKKYLMGTDVSTDWKEGSPIYYKGEYEGKKYQDKGIIKKFEPGEMLQTTYWSSMGGKEDIPENYNLVTYSLSAAGENTLVTLTQDNILSEKEKAHVIKNWEQVLSKLKEVVESGK